MSNDDNVQSIFTGKPEDGPKKETADETRQKQAQMSAMKQMAKGSAKRLLHDALHDAEGAMLRLQAAGQTGGFSEISVTAEPSENERAQAALGNLAQAIRLMASLA